MMTKSTYSHNSRTDYCVVENKMYILKSAVKMKNKNNTQSYDSDRNPTGSSWQNSNKTKINKMFIEGVIIYKYNKLCQTNLHSAPHLKQKCTGLSKQQFAANLTGKK